MLDVWQNSTSVPEMKKSLETEYPFLNWGCEKTLNTKLRRINDKSKQLKKNKNEIDLQLLMSSEFELPRKSLSALDSLPSQTQHKVKKIDEKARELVTENRELKRDIEKVENENENLTYIINSSENKVSILMNLLNITNKKFERALQYNQDSQKLEHELQQWEEKYTSLSTQFDQAVEELDVNKQKLKQLCTRNVNKKLKRRDDSIKIKDQEIKEKDREIDSMKDVCELRENDVKELVKEKNKLLVKICRLRKSKEKNVVDLNIEEINSFKEDIKLKEKKIVELEQANAILQDPVIDCFHDGKYSNEIRSTIMTLLTEGGVSQKKVNQVVQTVLTNLAGKTLSRLPSTGVKSRLLVEAKRVAQGHVAEEMLRNWKDQPDLPQGNTLHQDGTSKFHRHFESFQVTTSAGKTLSAGMAEVARGDADTLFSEFNGLISELANAIDPSKSSGLNHDIAKLTVSIIATMSDQGSVNPVFSKKLQTIREDLLPVVYEHWETIPNEMKMEMGKLFSFFCKMHIFVNMAGEVDKCLSQFEKNIIADGRNPFAFNSSESGTSRLVRTISKALTTHGCEKSGVGGHFLIFLREKGISNKLITFRGHRFNHLFYAAGASYYHISDVKEFLVKWADPNDLLKSIRFDAEETVYLSGIRALGIIDKVVTGPLWRIIESVPNVLALNNYLLQMKLQLEAWSQDASPILAGECLFSEDQVSITKDVVYESLVAPSENPVLDTYTQMALELCFGGMLLILERQAKDQLPGGRYWHLDPTTLNRMSSVPTTNTASERDFAQLDMLMRSKPSASTVAYESIIMWTNNKTSAWLSALPEMEYNRILDDARVNAPHMVEQIKLKQQALYTKKLEHLKERQGKKERQEEKTHSTKVKLTQKLTENGGLWTKEDHLDNYKGQHPESDYKEALITQIYFRKSVLASKGPRELFQQQSKGKIYSVRELEDNLKKILELNADDETEKEEPKLIYKDTEEIQEVVTSLKTMLRVRVEEGRNKIIVSQQKNILPLYLANPELIVGKRFKHKCRDPESREVEWYSGVVLGIFKDFVKKSKTEYTVKYDLDTAEWRFPLLKDFEKGDLIIVE